LYVDVLVKAPMVKARSLDVGGRGVWRDQRGGAPYRDRLQHDRPWSEGPR